MEFLWTNLSNQRLVETIYYFYFDDACFLPNGTSLLFCMCDLFVINVNTFHVLNYLSLINFFLVVVCDHHPVIVGILVVV